MVEVGQVWEFCGAYTVLVLRPRPDLDAKWCPSYGRPCYHDVVVLRNGEGNFEAIEDVGCEDWCGIQDNDEDWVRLS